MANAEDLVPSDFIDIVACLKGESCDFCRNVLLMQRHKVDSVHYLAATDDNHHQTTRMKKRSIFTSVNTKVGKIIVAAC